MPDILINGYSVDAQLHRACVAAFDVWRDGKGKLSGVLGREAFLGNTDRIVLRVVPMSAEEERTDPWKRERYLRTLRYELSCRPRKRAEAKEVAPPLGV